MSVLSAAEFNYGFLFIFFGTKRKRTKRKCPCDPALDIPANKVIKQVVSKAKRLVGAPLCFSKRSVAVETRFAQTVHSSNPSASVMLGVSQWEKSRLWSLDYDC